MANDIVVDENTSDSEDLEITVAEEDNLNEAPSSKDGRVLRFASESLSLDTSTTESEEVRTDRQRAGVTRTGVDPTGDISIELSFGSYDLLYEHAMLNRFEFHSDRSGTLGAVAADDQITSDTSTDGPSLAPVIEGQEVKLSGFSADVDGIYTVATVDTSATTHVLTVEENIASDVTGDGDESVGYNFMNATLGVDSANNQFTLDTTQADQPDGFGGYQQGQFIKTSGFATDTNNGYFYITSVDTSTDTHTITVRETLDTDESGVTAKIGGQRVENGTGMKSLSIQKHFTNLSDKAFNLYTGMRVVGFSETVEQGSNITGSFSFHGIELKGGEQTSAFGGKVDSNSNQIFSSADHVPRFIEGGEVLPIQSMDMTVDTQAREQKIVGQPQNINVGQGTFTLSGSLSVYKRGGDLIQKYSNFTNTSFSVLEEGEDGNAYVKTIHNANLTDGSENSDGPNSDIMTDLSFEAEKDDDSDTGIMMEINRFPANVI